MRQQVTGEFTQVSVTAGTLQNVSEFRNIEVASTQEKGTGIILKPLERIQFLEDTTVYVRTFGDNNGAGGRAYFTTEPFKLKVGRGNATKKIVLTDSFYQMYQVYPDTYQTMTEVPDKLDTSNVTNAYGMFSGCSSLTSIPELNTSNVTKTQYMFRGCASLTSVSEMDTSNVKNMSDMFRDCSSLTSIPELSTSNVTKMNGMFFGCFNLISVPDLDTSKVTNMNGMFMYCRNLTSIPNLDTSNVTDMGSMFSGCSNLTSIPSLDISSITDASRLKRLVVQSNITKVTLKNVKSSIKSQITSSLLKDNDTLTITFA